MGATSRRKGADGERAVVNYATIHGIPAERVIRVATSRTPDEGDVHLHGGRIVVQVKVGRAAQGAGPAVLGSWWADTVAQAVRVGGWPLLVVQARGVPASKPSDWDAHCLMSDVARHAGLVFPVARRVRWRLGDLLPLIGGVDGE